MEDQNKANEAGAGTGSEEAAASAVDVGKQIEDGSVANMDDYMKAKEPGVSRQAEKASEKEVITTGDAEGEEIIVGSEESEVEVSAAEEQEAEQDDGHESGLKALGLDDEQEKAVGKIIERRVAKPVAQRKAAEELAGKLREQLEELQGRLDQAGDRPASVDAPAIMLAETDAEVDRFESRQREALWQFDDWLDDHDRSDVYVVKGENGEEMEFSYSDVRRRRRELEREISDLVPKARKAVARRLQAVGEAKEKYPKLFDRNSEEHTRMQSILREAPQLKALPNYHILIGRMISGEALEKAPPPNVARKAPPRPTAAKPPETAAPSKTKTTSTQTQVNRDAKTMDEYMGISK